MRFPLRIAPLPWLCAALLAWHCGPPPQTVTDEGAPLTAALASDCLERGCEPPPVPLKCKGQA
jgi:hypothetical protein